MNGVRRVAVSLGAAVVLAALTLFVPSEHVMDCERDDPAPCVQVASGFPLPVIVDHHAISPVGSVGLISALLGEDFLLLRNLTANLLIWWAAMAAGMALVLRGGRR